MLDYILNLLQVHPLKSPLKFNRVCCEWDYFHPEIREDNITDSMMRKTNISPIV